MSAFTDIQAALMTAWAGVLPHPCAFEGRDFTPPDAAPWTAVYTLPASAAPAAIGYNAPIEHVVLQQIDINYPLNSGTGPLLADADTVADAFNPGKTVTYGSMRMMIEQCNRSSMRSDGTWSTVSLTIKWRGQQHRA